MDGIIIDNKVYEAKKAAQHGYANTCVRCDLHYKCPIEKGRVICGAFKDGSFIYFKRVKEPMKIFL